MSEPLTDQEMIEQYQAAMACFPETLVNKMCGVMDGTELPDTLENRVFMLVRMVETMAVLLAKCAADGQDIGIEL